MNCVKIQPKAVVERLKAAGTRGNVHGLRAALADGGVPDRSRKRDTGEHVWGMLKDVNPHDWFARAIAWTRAAAFVKHLVRDTLSTCPRPRQHSFN